MAGAAGGGVGASPLRCAQSTPAPGALAAAVRRRHGIVGPGSKPQDELAGEAKLVPVRTLFALRSDGAYPPRR
jgi:hypothetical protein